MSQDRRITLVAAGSALLAALPVITVFDHATWAIRAFLVVAAMCGGRCWAQAPGAPLGADRGDGRAALFGLTWLYPSSHEFIGIIPSPGTIQHFGRC